MIKFFIICLLRKYQRYISPDHSFWAKTMNKTPYCKYIPSCSQYMIDAIEKKGVIQGGIMGFFRVLRCHPWSKGGYDPVDKKNQ